MRLYGPPSSEVEVVIVRPIILENSHLASRCEQVPAKYDVNGIKRIRDMYSECAICTSIWTEDDGCQKEKGPANQKLRNG